jgi:hypothetical protein
MTVGRGAPPVFMTVGRSAGRRTERRSTRAPPLLLVLSSGYSPKDKEAIAEFGSFLPKPYSDSKLLEVLDAELTRKP